ncbi:MAG: hypothetical protein KDA91_02335 [Planctomycetaceae bacterium]|nr:hypothetical protein [Planctomycetaceae bacterium]
MNACHPDHFEEQGVLRGLCVARGHFFACTVACLLAATPVILNAQDSRVFQERILPLATAPDGSSCRDCHLSGVELAQYIQHDEASTFTALRAAGLINIKSPGQSKLLTFIARKPDEASSLRDTVRSKEHAAFSEWIEAAVRNPSLLSPSANSPPPTFLPPEVIRHARRDRVTRAFIDSIWNETGRCANCHNPELNRNKINAKHTREEVDAISWIVPRNPAATLERLVETGAIDLEHPVESSLLTKAAGLTEHGGGPKFFPGSDTYRKFAHFLTDYAATRNGDYSRVEDLPDVPEETFELTQQQLRLRDVPPEFGGMAIQVDFFAWDDKTGHWAEKRCATAFSRVNAKGNVWQNPIQLVRSSDDLVRSSDNEVQRASESGDQISEPLLQEGRYLVRVLVDQKGLTAVDLMHQLTSKDQVGEFEISGKWPPGYQPPRIHPFPR